MLGSKLKSESGFTLVELTVAVSLMGIIGVVFIGMISNYFVLITRNNTLAEMTVNSQNLLRTTVENIRFGDGVRQTNLITDSNSPNGGWNTNNSSFVIIIAVPALTSARAYIIDPSTGSPYMNELVYYRNGNKLMERDLANPSATGNRIKTTCPSNLASSSCPEDKLLATYVSAMTFTLYDQNAVLTTIPAEARSVAISLTIQRNATGQPLTVSNSIRVTLRNRF